MTDSEKHSIIQTLINECKWHFDNANNYYSKKAEFERREKAIIKPIGWRLYEEGNLQLMREVYEAVERTCLAQYGKNCRSALEMKWNGVGDWRG